MNTKNNKKKGHKKKLSDDLTKLTKIYKNEFNENKNDINKLEEENSLIKKQKTKLLNSDSIKTNYEFEQITENEIIKKVKFSTIEIIDVEDWKKYYLESEENTKELLSINQKNNRNKNINCTCTIL